MTRFLGCFGEIQIPPAARLPRLARGSRAPPYRQPRHPPSPPGSPSPPRAQGRGLSQLPQRPSSAPVPLGQLGRPQLASPRDPPRARPSCNTRFRAVRFESVRCPFKAPIPARTETATNRYVREERGRGDSQCLRARAATGLLPVLKQANRAEYLGINAFGEAASHTKNVPKRRANLNRMKLTHVCADDLRTRMRTIRGTTNEQSNKTMNVGNRGEQRMHECLCRLRDQKCVHTTSQLMYRACVAQTQAQMCPNHCKRCGLTLHTFAHTPAHNKHMQTLQNMITTPRVGVSNLCQNHCVAKARDGESQLQAQSTQITTPNMHPALCTIINLKPAVLSLLQIWG